MSSTSTTQTQSSNGSGADLTGVHPSAVGPSPNMTTATKTQPPSEQSTDRDESTVEGDSTYPEQKHAGKVGLGPNYHRGADLGDKMAGFKESVKGKITHNPDLAAKGHDRMTGELQRKEQEGDDKADPFAKPDEKPENTEEKETEEKEEKTEANVSKSTTSVPATNGSAHE
ncbi:hypothetical protein FB45DRAFT_1062248 [Roridomyces roridus]|uniref:Uncharacterized protein n=1 Tax=Roridomyces roridus TaxID=1738132 RepID=A0AAD7BHF1_9AGAR|nr:hypothetical protein FB45DRAFT_1062248 [Roridomyces roridus]